MQTLRTDILNTIQKYVKKSMFIQVDEPVPDNPNLNWYQGSAYIKTNELKYELFFNFHFKRNIFTIEFKDYSFENIWYDNIPSSFKDYLEKIRENSENKLEAEMMKEDPFSGFTKAKPFDGRLI